MICVNLESTNPFFNLAADEYLLKNCREEFFMLYVSDNSVVIGKHQVAHRETNTRFVAENNIPVIRRISGGGTVFHDSGNLNFSFILNSEQGRQVDFKKYTLPVLQFLSSVGIEAKLEGKSDLMINGIKISGNAEHVFRNRVLHHGTLLYDTDLGMLKGSIRNDTSKYSSRAVKSNPSPVMNLNNVLKNVFKNVLKNVSKYVDDFNGFRSGMINWFLNNYKGAEPGFLSVADKQNIESLALSKYRSWEWNYAYGPEYQFSSVINNSGVWSAFSLYVRDGIITEYRTDGSVELETALRKFIGYRHMPDKLKVLIEKENIFGQEFDIFNFF
jgi:lipoate-protein ligase A